MASRLRTGMLLVALFLPLSSPLLGCAKNQKEALSAVEFQRHAKAAYEKALEAFHDRDWVSVPTLMAEVKREYAGTKWARLAQLRIADAEFHQRSFPEAITSYREFLREFPNDEEVPYARYRVALCQFESRPATTLAPPLEERDLVNVRDADRSISEFLRDYPNYKERKHLLYMQEWVRGMLARHELYVARYYLRIDKYDAAIMRTEYALTNYKDTGLEPEALVLLGETHMKRHEPHKAADAFQIVLERYPESRFVEPATNFMNYLKETGALDGPAPAADPEPRAPESPVQVLPQAEAESSAPSE
jgi:outer membrane protein assembly factor BamD